MRQTTEIFIRMKAFEFQGQEKLQAYGHQMLHEGISVKFITMIVLVG